MVVKECEPFGSLLPGRNYSSGSYRFGFNGMEKDNEVYNAEGTSYTTLFRGYDARTAQWWSVDPDARKFPQWSVYQAMNRNPIVLVDPLGNSAGKTYHKETGKLIHDDGKNDKKVYFGTKSDGSDREDGQGHLNKEFASEDDILDVTDKFNAVLAKTANKWSDRKTAIEGSDADFTFGLGKGLAKNIEFGTNVAPGGLDDLKNNEDPNNEFYHPEKVGTTRGVFHDGYAFYNGRLKRFDDFGNMNFGAAGRGIGFSLDYLNFGAGLAQGADFLRGGTPAIGPGGGDETRDKLNIMVGYGLGDKALRGLLTR